MIDVLYSKMHTNLRNFLGTLRFGIYITEYNISILCKYLNPLINLD